jgi:hypothetical protein
MGRGPSPAAPIGLSTDCVSAAVVGLSWNLPQAGRNAIYEITRDGAALDRSSDTSFSDITVAPATHYSYTVRASGTAAPAATLEVNTPPASPSGDAPYCKSKHLEGMTVDWASGQTEPNGSDLWPVTWGRDGKVYAFFGDGGGFGGDNYRGRASFGIATMSAPPTPATRRNLYGGYNSPHPSNLAGKAGAIIAVGSDFYTLGGLYSPSELTIDPTRVSGAPNRLQFGYSKGNAYSWQAAPWSFCDSKDVSRGQFCASGFVHFGRGNSGAPDGQVYLIGFANSAAHWSDDVSEDEAATYLARVPPKQVLQLDDYTYFAGVDTHGRAIWTADQRQMRPIFVDRNGPRPGCNGRCNMASPLGEIVYNRALQRYIGVAQGNFVSQTSFYDAPHPWGPWTTISYNNIDPATASGGWANLGMAGGESLGVHIVNAWTSRDGLSLWMTYSSDGKAPTGASFPPEGTLMDSFNLVSARLIAGPALRRH